MARRTTTWHSLPQFKRTGIQVLKWAVVVGRAREDSHGVQPDFSRIVMYRLPAWREHDCSSIHFFVGNTGTLREFALILYRTLQYYELNPHTQTSNRGSAVAGENVPCNRTSQGMVHFHEP